MHILAHGGPHVPATAHPCCRCTLSHVDAPSPCALECVLQKKFLVPADLTIGQFMYVIRKVRPRLRAFEPSGSVERERERESRHSHRRSPLSLRPLLCRVSQRIKLAPEQAIFLFVSGGTLPPSVATLQSVYDQHHDEDGFLYMTYSGENFFG